MIVYGCITNRLNREVMEDISTKQANQILIKNKIIVNHYVDMEMLNSKNMKSNHMLKKNHLLKYD